MEINLANIIEEWNNKKGWIYAFYYRGSILYGTSDENSVNKRYDSNRDLLWKIN